MHKTALALSCIGIVFGSAVAHAQIRLELDATSIVGNREAPRIVYLMAWQPAPKGDVLQQSLGTMHDTEFKPIDRDVFKRRIEYHRLMFDTENDKN
ncbi:MAG: hypothetical protein AB1810_01895 [Pseudomonadota bacterium]